MFEARGLALPCGTQMAVVVVVAVILIAIAVAVSVGLAAGASEEELPSDPNHRTILIIIIFPRL